MWPAAESLFNRMAALGNAIALRGDPTSVARFAAMAKQLEPETDPNEFDDLIDVDALALEFEIDDGSTL